MQVKVSDQCFGSDTYDCKLTWPDQTEGRAHEARPDGKTLLGDELEAELAAEEGKPPPPPPRNTRSLHIHRPRPISQPVISGTRD